MSFRNAIRLEHEDCRILAAGAIGVNYAAVGTPLDNPSNQLYIQNLTDATIWWTLDLTKNGAPMVAGGFFLSDITSNKSNDTGMFVARGTTVYVKQLGVPAAGSVYVTTFHGAP